MQTRNKERIDFKLFSSTGQKILTQSKEISIPSTQSTETSIQSTETSSQSITDTSTESKETRIQIQLSNMTESRDNPSLLSQEELSMHFV